MRWVYFDNNLLAVFGSEGGMYAAPTYKAMRERKSAKQAVKRPIDATGVQVINLDSESDDQLVPYFLKADYFFAFIKICIFFTGACSCQTPLHKHSSPKGRTSSERLKSKGYFLIVG